MIGQIISHYKILEKIGEGGMGVVYKAEDTKLRRNVALKFLPPVLTRDPEAKARFIHEAQAASAMQHNNVCNIHDIDETSDGQIFIVIDYYKGETLKEKIKDQRLKIKEVMDIAIQIAEGLVRAHEKGIIHRDIKPANILVTSDGVVKILDFGLAKLVGSQTKLTKAGTTLGTIAYMSPEQARGEEVDHRTDIWSLGVVFYEMVSGESPFCGEYPQAVLYSILNEQPQPLARARSDMPAGLERIILQALSKNPKDRYQNLEDMLADLKAVAEGLKPLKVKANWIRGRIFGIRKIYIYAATLFIALLLGLNVGGLRSKLTGLFSGSAAAVRLAVLPFANLSNDPEQEYFSDGMTQEMISQLGRFHPQRLSVIARTSVMRYKNSNTPIDQIGKELRVDYVMEGSVKREGNRVRISAELIHTGRQTQLWGDVFEREMSGILALQSEVARNVASALSFNLLPADQSQLATSRTVNPEAHEAYLRGSFHLMKVTPKDFDTAEKYFDLAIEKDPAYAPAYAGRASVWLVRSFLGFAAREEAGLKAKAAALKAIELDKNLAAAHDALAGVKEFVGDYQGARESLQRAIELNPNSADIQCSYGWLLLNMGLGEEAQVHFEKAVDLDPFNPMVLGYHAFFLYDQRRYDEAIAEAREAQRFQEDHLLVLNALSNAYHKKGMEKEAIKATMDVFKVGTNDDARVHAALAECFGQRDYAEAMRCAAEALAAIFPEMNILQLDIAYLYAMAGDKEKAIEWLEKGFEARNGGMLCIGADPIFDDLRSDPRFQDLLRRMKFPADATK